MSAHRFLPNGGRIALSDIPVQSLDEFRRQVLEGVRDGARLSALFGSPSGKALQLFAVLAWPDAGRLSLVSTIVADSYPALTPDCRAAHMFERELAEQWGVHPQGHPWLKPVRFQPPRREVTTGSSPCGVTDYFQVKGAEVHEVAVGPVHAGIIEPGHFRFQCHGEAILHLEISLGYQHRGVERALVGGPDARTPHYLETLAGDTTIGHALAGYRVMEALAGCSAPARAEVLRGVALELERLANHIGDLGALAGDIGFLPTQSFCGRLRGDLLNLTALMCGNRFGRRLLRLGGMGYDLDVETAALLRERLADAMRDVETAIGLLWSTPSVLARFEGTGAIGRETCVQLGLVGVAARACGLQQDVRSEFPWGIYRLAHIPAVTWHTGDVFARAFVRGQEVQRSADFISDQLMALPVGPVTSRAGRLAPKHLAVALVEGWRGEICHVALTDDAGRFALYKVVDPSFHNWYGLAMAMRHQAISDFPLCNKSFNLSYCGHDL